MLQFSSDTLNEVARLLEPYCSINNGICLIPTSQKLLLDINNCNPTDMNSCQGLFIAIGNQKRSTQLTKGYNFIGYKGNMLIANADNGNEGINDRYLLTLNQIKALLFEKLSSEIKEQLSFNGQQTNNAFLRTQKLDLKNIADDLNFIFADEFTNFDQPPAASDQEVNDENIDGHGATYSPPESSQNFNKDTFATREGNSSSDNSSLQTSVHGYPRHFRRNNGVQEQMPLVKEQPKENNCCSTCIIL